MGEEQILVRFIKAKTPYAVGDIVWIPPDEFKKLLKFGFVVKQGGKEIKTAEMDVVEEELPPKKDNSLICPICGKKFKTKKSLNAHKKKAHGIK